MDSISFWHSTSPDRNMYLHSCTGHILNTGWSIGIFEDIVKYNEDEEFNESKNNATDVTDFCLLSKSLDHP